MGKHLLTLLFLCAATAYSAAQTPIVVQINAGSRAAWGTNQNLLIDANGKCSFYLNEVGRGVKDSSHFTIAPTQLDSFLKKAESLGFFNLQPTYHKGVDGAGIFIAMSSGGKEHDVDLINTDLPAINSLVAWLNDVLKPHNIRIYYGQK